MQVGSDQQTSALLYRGLVSEQPLPDEEEFQFLMMTHGFFLGMQNSYLLAQEGTIDEELRNSLINAIGGIQNLPGMTRYWRQRKSYLHSGFVEWVERIAVDSSDVTMDLYDLSNNQAAEADPQ